MPEENGTQPEAQQPPPPNVQMAASITPQGLALTVPLTLTIGDELMFPIIRQWLAAHPQQRTELIQEALTAKQQELAIIKHVNRSKQN